MGPFLLFLIAYSCVLGTGNSEEVTSLKGSQGSEVVFKLDSKKGNNTQIIMWISTSKQLILASTRKNSPNCITNSTQYEGRLSLLPDNSLMLSNLTTEDSGCYEAEIKSVLGEIITQKFNLTVLENESTNLKYLWIVAVILVLFSIVVVLFICRKPRGTRFCRLSRRDESHTEENGLSQMDSSQTREERLRMLENMSVITVQEDGMSNGLATQQENRRDQHRQELSD